MPKSSTIDEYVSTFPPEQQRALEEMRALIAAMAPDAVETISYSMPTFDLNGRHLVHFAGYNKHTGFYPTASGVEAFLEELAGYKISRGAIQFPLDQPLPLDLIRRIVQFRVDEVEGTQSR